MLKITTGVLWGGAAGIFVGQLLFHGFISKDWSRSFWVGALSALIFVALMVAFIIFE